MPLSRSGSVSNVSRWSTVPQSSTLVRQVPQKPCWQEYDACTPARPSAESSVSSAPTRTVSPVEVTDTENSLPSTTGGAANRSKCNSTLSRPTSADRIAVSIGAGPHAYQSTPRRWARLSIGRIGVIRAPAMKRNRRAGAVPRRRLRGLPAVVGAAQGRLRRPQGLCAAGPRGRCVDRADRQRRWPGDRAVPRPRSVAGQAADGRQAGPAQERAYLAGPAMGHQHQRPRRPHPAARQDRRRSA